MFTRTILTTLLGLSVILSSSVLADVAASGRIELGQGQAEVDLELELVTDGM